MSRRGRRTDRDKPALGLRGAWPGGPRLGGGQRVPHSPQNLPPGAFAVAAGRAGASKGGSALGAELAAGPVFAAQVRHSHVRIHVQETSRNGLPRRSAPVHSCMEHRRGRA